MWLYKRNQLMIWGNQYVRCSLKPSCTVYLGQRVNDFLGSRKCISRGNQWSVFTQACMILAFNANLRGETSLRFHGKLGGEINWVPSR